MVARKGNSPAPTAVGVVLPLAVADGRQSLSRQLPMGQLGQSPSQAATAASSIGSRSSSSSNQARSRPTGLPLARKASHAEPMGKSVGNSVGKPVCKPVGRQAASQKGKGSDMSVTEMMQWLDRKLGQASAGRPMQTDQTG